MQAVEVLEIAKDSLWVLIKVSLPIMLVALVVGLVISLFQALTQIQEMTLSFVPKMIAIFFALLAFMPYIGNELSVLSEQIGERIANIEKR